MFQLLLIFKHLYIPLISLGMVFVKLPSADLAAEAIDILKESVVDGKDVFVKLLPTVHVSYKLEHSVVE